MKLFLLLELICLIAASAAAPFYELLFDADWETFKAKYNKKYLAQEDSFRRDIFTINKYVILKHNKLYNLGFKTFALGINQFADMLPHEFSSVMLGLSKLHKKTNKQTTTYLSPANVVLPKSVDWRKHGYVTPVKDQGQCGSCWAFSTTGSLEGQHFKKTGKLVSLSEQNLVDCSRGEGNEGCNGGLKELAFEYIKSNGGIDTEESYKYEAQDDICRFNKSNVGATITGFVDLPQGNERKLQEALATIGPISVSIDASKKSFQLYSHGVYYEPECSSLELDHGVLAVGYGTDEKGNDYWIVKNSWGDNWGEKGYVRMARNKYNNCGIATEAAYPLV